MFIVRNNNLSEPKLSPEDEHHLLNVQRTRVGEAIRLSDNQGRIAIALIKNRQPLEFDVTEVFLAPAPHPITLLLPLIDQSRLEWIIEKACELNVSEIQLTWTDNTQNFKQNENKLNRLKKIALSAQKQSGRGFPLIINEPVYFKTFLDKIATHPETLIVAGSVKPTQPLSTELFTHTTKKYIIAIGPEGGFTTQENEMLTSHNTQFLHLPTNTLRSETAILALTTLIINHIGKVL